MPHMTRAENAEDMLIPASDEKVAHLAVIEAVRSLGSQVGRVAETVSILADKQDQANEKINRVYTDVTVMKQMNDRVAVLEQQVRVDHEKRIKELEIADARLSGAKNGLDTFREWAPTVIAIMVGVGMLIKFGALH